MDELRQRLIEYYQHEVEKLDQLTAAMKMYGIAQEEFDPNLNLNKFKREMIKFIESLGE